MKWKNVARSATYTLTVLLINFVVPSQNNGFSPRLNFSLSRLWDTEVADKVYNARLDDAVFNKRPIVISGQKAAKEKLALPYQFSFNLINYLTLFVFLLLMPELVQQIMHDRTRSAKVQTAIFCSFPILFAFFGSIFTYDDFVQYLLLSIFLIFLFREKMLFSAIFLLSACICRETSLLYMLFIMPLLFQSTNKSPLRFLPFLLVPLVYAFYLGISSEEDLNSAKYFLLNKRFYSWQNNFESLRTARESLTTVVITLGIPTYLLLQTKQRLVDEGKKAVLRGALLLLFINTFIVLTTALVREARLLFLPLIVILPLIKHELAAVESLLKERAKKLTFQREGILLIVSVLFSTLFYATKTVGTGYIFKTYAVVYFFVFLEIIVERRGSMIT